MAVKSTTGTAAEIESGADSIRNPGNGDASSIAQVIAGLNDQINQTRVQIDLNRRNDPNYNDSFDRSQIAHLELTRNAHQMVLNGLS